MDRGPHRRGARCRWDPSRRLARSRGGLHLRLSTTRSPTTATPAPAGPSRSTVEPVHHRGARSPCWATPAPWSRPATRSPAGTPRPTAPAPPTPPPTPSPSPPNTTLYAQWTALPTYTVTYDGNSSTGGDRPGRRVSPYTTGATVTVLGNTGTLVKTGYTFAGWNTAANGSGTAYAPRRHLHHHRQHHALRPVDRAAHLHRHLRRQRQHRRRRSRDPSSPYTTGATVTVLGNTGTLVKTGYTFAGWNTAANGTGTAYAAAPPSPSPPTPRCTPSGPRCPPTP